MLGRLPRSHNPCGPPSRGCRNRPGRPGGVINCYSRVLDPSTIRVCFGQVYLSPAETYFSNYRTQPAALPSSLFCPTNPHSSSELGAPLRPSLLSSLSKSARLSVPLAPLPSLLPTKCLRFDASMISSFETPLRRSSRFSAGQPAPDLDRSSSSGIAELSLSLFYDAGVHPLPIPTFRASLHAREHRAFRGGGAFGCRGACGCRTRRFRHDASLALRPIRGFSRDAAFPR